MMKWGQKGTIQKTLQRLIRGGLLKTAIKLSVNEATLKDWKNTKIQSLQRSLSSEFTLNKVKLQIRFHLCILFKTEDYQVFVVLQTMALYIKTGKWR